MKNTISQLRKRNRMTQKMLSEAVNVSRQTISAIENDHYSPTLRLAFRISHFFKIPIEKIFIYEKK